jgi:phosphoglycerate dehydrogenase-like enzyme
VASGRHDVLVTPHIAGAIEEALARVAAIVWENVLRVARGEEPLHRVAW